VAIQKGLQALGIKARVENDNITVIPQTLQGGTIDSFGDHRIAMAFSMAALCAQDAITIRNCQPVATSFPAFAACAAKAGLAINEVLYP